MAARADAAAPVRATPPCSDALFTACARRTHDMSTHNEQLHAVLQKPLSNEAAAKMRAELAAAKVIAQKAAACGLRPVPASFARTVRSLRLDPAPPPQAFRNWNYMKRWFEST